MLVQLTISDFAIIRHLEIHFRPGLNILSGETGAGKSIIINAVNLILGERASTDLIRTGSREARVEALFELPPDTILEPLLTEFHIPCDGQVVIKRIISRQGRNRILVNDSLVTLQMLAKLGTKLISISGQHEHQSLLKPDNHLYILDDFGGLTEERRGFGERFEAYLTLKEERRALARQIAQAQEREELARFQMEEIDRSAVQPGEDKALEEERGRLRHAEQLLTTVDDVFQVLYEDETSILGRLARCVRDLEKAAAIDSRLGALKETMDAARLDLEEAVPDLRGYRQGVAVDPSRLEAVEERLQVLNRLKKKYGSTLEEVLAFRNRLLTEREGLDEKREDLTGMEERIKAQESELLAEASELSLKRKGAAEALQRAVVRELRVLDMKGTRFTVHFAEEPVEDGSRGPIGALGPDGVDTAAFLLSPNVGEDLKPINRIASGGELSRIMLALKTILARSASVETIIFDEVDAGIGGATAEVVGEKLRSLARYNQLLCISHLHQIASKGDTHFLVEKRVVDSRTRTVISELDAEGRVREIARMLGGKTISPQALAHARELLA